MARALLPEDLWSLVTGHLPTHCRLPKGGWPRLNDRATLTGILFVLKTGISWEYLPRELGCSGGITCWPRPHEWMKDGVGQRVLGCADEVSQHASRDAALSRVKGSADSAGSLSAS